MENEENLRIEQLKAQIERLEKLSSLGMLSAGIAHEIQNPLNFVINFSKLSDKLLEDLSDILELWFGSPYTARGITVLVP